MLNLVDLLSSSMEENGRACQQVVRIDCFEMSSENIIIPVQRYVALFLDTNPCTAMSEGAQRQKLQSDAMKLTKRSKYDAKLDDAWKLTGKRSKTDEEKTDAYEKSEKTEKTDAY